jgi:hypothetical protein
MPKSPRPNFSFLVSSHLVRMGTLNEYKQSYNVRANPRPLSTTKFKSQTLSQCGCVSCQIFFDAIRRLRESSHPAILISRMKPTLTVSEIYTPITIFDPGSITSDFGYPSEADHRLNLRETMTRQRRHLLRYRKMNPATCILSACIR